MGTMLESATCVYYHVFTNIFSQNDTGQSGGLGGESLEDCFTGATSAAVFIHSLDACYLWSGGRPEKYDQKKTGHVHK